MPHAIILRDLAESDLPILFEQQNDPEASRMAAFRSRDPSDRDAFMTHWKQRRLFGDNAQVSAFTLAHSNSTPGGVLFTRYVRSGEVRTGTFEEVE